MKEIGEATILFPEHAERLRGHLREHAHLAPLQVGLERAGQAER